MNPSARRRGLAVAVEEGVAVGTADAVVPEGPGKHIIDLVESGEVGANLEAGGLVGGRGMCITLWLFATCRHDVQSLAPVQAPVTT